VLRKVGDEAPLDHSSHCILTTGRNTLDGLDIVIVIEARVLANADQG
jgi:hypothetical protein